MLPLTSYGQTSLAPWIPNEEFDKAMDALMSAHRDGSRKLTHLAFVARSDLAGIPLWETYVENVVSLARRVGEGQLAFTTASEAWERIQRGRREPQSQE